MILHHWRYSRP